MGEKIVFELDLDDIDFVSKLLKSKGLLKDLGNGKDLDPLNTKMKDVGVSIRDAFDTNPVDLFLDQVKTSIVVAATLTAAYLAVKVAFDAVFDAEKIRAVNVQFDMLAKQAGIAGDTLKEKLVKAVDGLANDREVLEAVNKAIVKIGDGASRSAELFEIAKKSAALFGGSIIDNYNAMIQAIATGNQRQLKQLGIIVDSNKALKDYAASIGVAVDTLSQQGKQHALLNAVIDKGNKSLKDVNLDVLEANNNWTRFKVTMIEVKETAELVFDKAFGGALKGALVNVRDFAGTVRDLLKSSFGDGKDAAESELRLLEDRLKDLNKNLQEEITGKDTLGGQIKKWVSFGDADAGVKLIQAQIAETGAQIDKVKARLAAPVAKGESGGTTAAAATGENGDVDRQKEQQSQAKFEEELLKLRQARIQSQINLAQTEEQANKLYAQQKVALEQETAAQIQAVQLSNSLSADQKRQQIDELNRNEQQKLVEYHEQALKRREQLDQNYVAHATSVWNQVARAQSAASNQAVRDMQGQGKLGNTMYDGLEKIGTNTFQALGQAAIASGNGIAAAQQAIREATIGVVADMAFSYGKTMLLANTFPPLGPNPIAMAGGIGLMTLSGILKGIAGGSSKVSGDTGGASGGSGSVSPPDVNTSAPSVSADMGAPKPDSSSATPGKSVTIQVAGNYFETEQTKQRLIEMIREQTDATDFKYVQIGGT